MSNNVLRLEMSFPTSNDLIDGFNQLFCSWGQIKTPKDSNGNIRGGTTPLWANPSITFFRIIFIICLICSLLFVGAYVGLQFYKGTLNIPTSSSSSSANKTSGRQYVNIDNEELNYNSLFDNLNTFENKNITLNYAQQTTGTTSNAGTTAATTSGTTSGTTTTGTTAGTTSGTTTTGTTAGTTSGTTTTGNNSGTTSGTTTTGNNSGTTSGTTTTGNNSGTTSGTTITGNNSGTTTGTTTTGTTNSSSSSTVNIYEKPCFDKAYTFLNMSWTVIGGAILLVNAIYHLILSYTEYASDQEWSRYLTLIVFFWVFLVAFTVLDFLYFVQINNASANDLKSDFEKAPLCKQFFNINMYINIIVPSISAIILIFILIKLFMLASKFFISSYVEHSARCDDENIVII